MLLLAERWREPGDKEGSGFQMLRVVSWPTASKETGTLVFEPQGTGFCQQPK